MIPRIYQEEESDNILEVLRAHALVYIAWEERTGKSLTGVRVVEKSMAQTCLIITKRKAKVGWDQLFKDYKYTKQFDVITYGQAKNYKGDPDIVILDEAHNYISGFPKPSQTWLAIKKLIFGKPLIYMSATPHAQGYQLLYHQFALSAWSPFTKYSNFYRWFKEYGIPYTIQVHGKDVNQYTRVKDDRIAYEIGHLFNTKTRKELGFEHEPKDKLCHIELSDKTKKTYNTLLKDKVLDTKDVLILADSTMKLRSALHMIEGGTIKTTTNHKPEKKPSLLLWFKEKVEEGVYLYHSYYDLGNREKIEYILKTWGDSDDVAIMYNYKGEKVILERCFKNAKILQATSNAEGVELSHIRHLIIYSQDFSTARHTQRRARQASKDRDWAILVHFLLIKKGISEQVYKTVSINKVNYVDSRFTKEKL